MVRARVRFLWSRACTCVHLRVQKCPSLIAFLPLIQSSFPHGNRNSVTINRNAVYLRLSPVIALVDVDEKEGEGIGDEDAKGDEKTRIRGGMVKELVRKGK